MPPPRFAEDDGLPVGRPEGGEVVPRIEREARADAPREVADPDVVPTVPRIAEHERQPVAAGREHRVGVVAGIPDRRELLALPIEPGEPATVFSRAVGENSIARHGELGEPGRDRPDVLGQGHRLAGGLHRLRVERLGDQRVLAHEQQMARRRIGHQRLRGRERPGLLRVQGADPVHVVLGLLTLGHIEEVASVGQELRPGDLGLLAGNVRIDLDHRRSAFRRDAQNGIRGAAVEEDHAGRAPGAVRPRRIVADLLRRAAGSFHLLQLAGGEEADEAAIG